MGSTSGGVGGSSSSGSGNSGGGVSSGDGGSDNSRSTASRSSKTGPSQTGMTGSERTQDGKPDKDTFDNALDNASKPASPNQDGGTKSAADAKPATEDNRGGVIDSAGNFFGGLATTLSAPPTDARGNPRSTSPVADRINNTVNYSVDDVFGVPANPARDAAIAMANAEFGVGMEVMRRDMNRAIDKSVADYDQKIADVDQQLAEINEQLRPKSLNGIGGLGTIGSVPAETARTLMAEGRALTDQKREFETKRAEFETARNIPDALDMAHIARDVYKPESALANSHISRLSHQELKELGFKTGLLDNKKNGFHAEVYRNSITGEAVLAFKGTDFNSRADWVNSLKQGANLESAQYEQAKEVAVAFSEAFSGENKAITGHSLGGGMGAYAALATGIEATTFNASGLSAGTLDRLGGVTREDAFDLVTAHHVEGEMLSGRQDSKFADLGVLGLVGIVSPAATAGVAIYTDGDPIPEAVGTRLGYEALNTKGLPADFQGGLASDFRESVDLHFMDAMLNTLRHERQRIEDETRPQ